MGKYTKKDKELILKGIELELFKIEKELDTFMLSKGESIYKDMLKNQ